MLTPKIQKMMTVTSTATPLFSGVTPCKSIEIFSDDGGASNGNSANACIMIGSPAVTVTSGAPLRKGGCFSKDAPEREMLDAGGFNVVCAVAGQIIQVILY